MFTDNPLIARLAALLPVLLIGAVMFANSTFAVSGAPGNC